MREGEVHSLHRVLWSNVFDIMQNKLFYSLYLDFTTFSGSFILGFAQIAPASLTGRPCLSAGRQEVSCLPRDEHGADTRGDESRNPVGVIPNEAGIHDIEILPQFLSSPPEFIPYVLQDGDDNKYVKMGVLRPYELVAFKLYHCGTEYFLKQLDRLLAQEQIEKGSFSGIIVVLGDGSFSSVRMAVMYGNLLAYSLEIPVVSVSSLLSSSLPQVSFEVYKKEYFPCFMTQGIALLKKCESRKSRCGYISPDYSKEPHITYPPKKIDITAKP